MREGLQPAPRTWTRRRRSWSAPVPPRRRRRGRVVVVPGGRLGGRGGRHRGGRRRPGRRRAGPGRAGRSRARAAARAVAHGVLARHVGRRPRRLGVRRRADGRRHGRDRRLLAEGHGRRRRGAAGATTRRCRTSAGRSPSPTCADVPVQRAGRAAAEGAVRLAGRGRRARDRVDLGDGWVQETVEVNGSRLTVASDDPALRHPDPRRRPVAARRACPTSSPRRRRTCSRATSPATRTTSSG